MPPVKIMIQNNFLIPEYDSPRVKLQDKLSYFSFTKTLFGDTSENKTPNLWTSIMVIL
jgi:hypothetical protein